MLVRPAVYRGGPSPEFYGPGDILGGGESLVNSTLPTVGAGLWTGALIASGLIYRTGPAAGYVDTTDTATNIQAALSGNNQFPLVAPGVSFRMLFINTVAQALTFTAGTGVITGLGTLTVAASLRREYLWTVLNTTPSQIIQSNTTNASAVVTFVLPPGIQSWPIGSDPMARNITPGALVSGTGISGGTTVLGVTQGIGGLIGVTLSANATATSAAGGVALTFGPTMRIDSLGAGTL